jgi:hypothetical protein
LIQVLNKSLLNTAETALVVAFADVRMLHQYKGIKLAFARPALQSLLSALEHCYCLAPLRRFQSPLCVQRHPSDDALRLLLLIALFVRIEDCSFRLKHPFANDEMFFNESERPVAFLALG